MKGRLSCWESCSIVWMAQKMNVGKQCFWRRERDRLLVMKTSVEMSEGMINDVEGMMDSCSIIRRHSCTFCLQRQEWREGQFRDEARSAKGAFQCLLQSLAARDCTDSRLSVRQYGGPMLYESLVSTSVKN